jgi:hypothetical protein
VRSEVRGTRLAYRLRVGVSSPVSLPRQVFFFFKSVLARVRMEFF